MIIWSTEIMLKRLIRGGGKLLGVFRLDNVRKAISLGQCNGGSCCAGKPLLPSRKVKIIP